MGRKPKNPEDRKTTLYSFHCDDVELMTWIFRIAKRENKPVGEIFIEALREYNQRHGAGNFQTLIYSFEEGGERSEGQIEQEIFRDFESYPEWKDIELKDIYSRLRELEYSLDNIRIVGDRIARKLHEAGKVVWR